MAEKKSILERLGIIEVVPVDGEEQQENRQDELNIVPFQEEASQPQPKKPEPAPKYEEANGDISLDTFNSAADIFKCYHLDKDNKQTVYILDEYAKALPNNLPLDLKGQSVVNIVRVSGLDIDALKRDGKNRITELEKYMDGFTRRTNDVINVCECEIAELEKKIANYKRMINERNNLQEKQRMTCEFEANRINEILNFVE